MATTEPVRAVERIAADRDTDQRRTADLLAEAGRALEPPVADRLAVDRREERWLVTEAAADAVASRLDGELRRCTEWGASPSPIVTTYLDRPDGALLRRYLARGGRSLRVRLRCYGAAGTRAISGLVLERKRGGAGLTHKRRVWLEAARIEQLLRDAGAPGLAALGLTRLGAPLLPVVAVGCERAAWVSEDGAVRVTLDRRLARSIPGASWMAAIVRGVLPDVVAEREAPAVLEVKRLRTLRAGLGLRIGEAVPAPAFSKLAWALGAGFPAMEGS